MRRAAPIFSTLPDYGNVMEPWTAECAPAAFRLTLARRVGLHYGPVLPPVCRIGKRHQELTLAGRMNGGEGIWSRAQNKGDAHSLSAELGPSYFGD